MEYTKFYYENAAGRMVAKFCSSRPCLKVMDSFTHSKVSKRYTRKFIRKNNINLADFENKKYDCYADFFVRKKKDIEFSEDEMHVISPCDGLVSVYDIDSVKQHFKVKSIWYTLNELIENADVAGKYNGGKCVIYRLRASDYHRFHYIDDCIQGNWNYIPGKLHSVQPITLDYEPVFRVNKRTWCEMNTKNFGDVLQIEVGAVLVGGFAHSKEEETYKRGDEMGRFELAGSTIIQIFSKDIANRMVLNSDLFKNQNEHGESEVQVGETVFYLK